MKDETIKVVVAQICIAVLALGALASGIDGVVLGAALGSLANLGGFLTGQKKSE